METRAKLVVIGAGIVGCSTVYHLAKHGWRDMVVVDQGPLFETGGSTSHAPGLVFQTNPSRMMAELAQRTVRVYNSLELDGQPCFHSVGSMEIAWTEERATDLHRRVTQATAWGIEGACVLSPQEAWERVPLLNRDRLFGAYFVPTDGLAKAVRACEAMGRYAQAEKAASFHGRTVVTGFEISNGGVKAVLTDQGRIETEMVLLCAGIWGPRVARLAGVTVPLYPCEHLYARTAPLKELAGETREVVHPVLRHQDLAMYFRQHADCYGFGSYKHEPMLVAPDDILSHEEAPVMPSLREFKPEHFRVAHQAAMDLMPALAGLELPYQINGMFSFTPDAFPVLGQSLEVEGFWVAEAVWVTHGGGVGTVMAEWLAEGAPSFDLREADINRFHPHVLTTAYAKARAAQQYREIYDIIHPLQQMEQPRPLRMTPFHPRLAHLGARFFENVGWERPQWFESNAPLLEGRPAPSRTGWEARYWSPIQAAEHWTTREHVALYDLTPFTKLEVSGPGALAFLERLAANWMDRPIGKVTYTSLLTERAGIRADLTVTRLATDRFLVLTGGGIGMLDLSWLLQHRPKDGSVTISDVTSKFCALGLWGPKARAVLEQVCEQDVSNAAFPYFTAQRLELGHLPVLALRVSYVGELGWEIYTLTEYGLALWDLLWEAGQPHGLIAAGGGAFDSLRLEKGYRLWGADIHTEYNPHEAGLAWTTRPDKPGFIGRDALLRIAEVGPARKLCCLTLDDPAAAVLGKEPLMDGPRVLGYVTSANYGYSVGKFIVYGYLPLDHARPGASVEVAYFNRRYRATVQPEPLFDPENLRLKS